MTAVTTSVIQLLDDLAKCVLNREEAGAFVGLCKPITPNDWRQLTRRSRVTSFQTLLSYGHEGVSVNRVSVYDRLLAKSYELRSRCSSEDADSLVNYVDVLRQLPSSSTTVDCESLLKCLLALADTGGMVDRPTSVIALSYEPNEGSNALRRQRVHGKHTYEHFPKQMFQFVDNVILQKKTFEFFDGKLFERCPGFSSYNTPLSCHRFCSSPMSNTVAPTLYGALSHPLQDAWQLDVRLDFPELLEESPAPRIPFEPSRFAVSTSRTAPLPAVDEDEGFVETTETPSSTCSFGGRVADTDDLWSAVLLDNGFDWELSKSRYSTWETHGSYYVPREKPFLSEGGAKAIDKVIVCLQHEMSLVNADLPRIHSFTSSTTAVYHDAISVLIAIPSRTFIYNQTYGLFVLAPISVSGLSSEAVEAILANFGGCGRAYKRLESVCRLKETSQSLVQRALFKAIESYLRYYQESVLNLRRDEDGRLLRLVELTCKLRRQICCILRLCFLDGHFEDERIVISQLPRGVRLLQHLYDAVESNPGGVADDRIVFLSFFLAAAEPYLQYVRSWAFEGWRRDPYDEFPVAEDAECLRLRDDQFWKKTLRLSDTEDPLLGGFSSSVFVCGKSLHLLRLCCPQHHLFSSTVEVPSLEIAFSEDKQMELRSRGARYHSAIKAEGERLACDREVRRLVQEKDKEELFRQVQLVTKLSMMKHQHESNVRRKADMVKKRHLMADLQAQIELRSRTKYVESSLSSKPKDLLAEREVLIDTSPTLTPSTEKSTSSDEQQQVNSKITAAADSALLDSNMNPAMIEDAIASARKNLGLDPNANPDMSNALERPCDDVVLRKNISAVDNEDDDLTKGTKRKQDRDSIDFDAGGMARRYPPNLEHHRRSFSEIVSSPTVRGRAIEPRHGGVLVEGSTFAVLRTRGRSAHGHSSDSTIQKLMYGDPIGLPLSRTSYAVAHSPKITTSVKQKTSRPTESDVFTNIRVEPYIAAFIGLDQPPMADIFKSKPSHSEKFEDEISVATLFRLPLSVVLHKCLSAPLCAQILRVDSCLLEFFVVTQRAEEHLSALKDYFFMQDGEFGQTLCDLLFERFSTTPNPNELLNPVVLNSILTGALALSSARNQFSDNLGFVVQFMPAAFHQNSPSALNCLQLSYHVEWPLNILISSDDLVHYERVFSFVLQMRRCLWSLGNVYSLLKELDSTSTLFTASPHFRSLQFFRHEMLHFIRSLYEYIGVQVFQASWFRLRQQIATVRNLDELLVAHSKYLRLISFRCLLHHKATPVMRVVQDLFAIVLKFRSQLMVATWTLNPQTKVMEVDCYTKLCSSFMIFRDYSTFLYKVILKLAQRGYQTHLMEFLLNLDFNDHYSTLSSKMEDDVSCPSLSTSSVSNFSI